MTHSIEHPLPRSTDDAPSDLELDRLHLGELSPQEEADVKRRLAQDPHGEERLQHHSAGFAAFPNLDPAAMVAAIHRRVVAEEVAEEADRAPSLLDRLTGWLKSGWGPALVGAAAAVTVVVATGVLDSDSNPGPGPGQDVVLTKGSLKLSVFRAAAGSDDGSPAMSGEPFSPGDSLSFAVDTPAEGHVMVVGVEPAGSTYAAYPLGSSAAAPTPEGLRQLDGAVALDDAFAGGEWLHLVWCPEPFQLANISPNASDRSLLTLPAMGCKSDAFELAGAR